MTLLMSGLVAFFAAHSFTMFREPRARLIERIGPLPYRGLHSLVSLAGFIAIVIGYGDAPRIDLWAPPVWLRPFAMMLMLPVFVLLAAAYLPCNIKARVRNPMLLAVKIWAFAHLLVNGDLASMLLFGSFLAWAVVDLIAVKRSGRSAVVAAPRELYDAVAITLGLVVYGLVLTRFHVYLAGVPLLTV
ncbi:MAG: NnrU family protein [Gammaproteobacteria bacterium]